MPKLTNLVLTGYVSATVGTKLSSTVLHYEKAVQEAVTAYRRNVRGNVVLISLDKDFTG